MRTAHTTQSTDTQAQVRAGVSDEEIAGYQRYVEPTMPSQRREFFQMRDVVYMVVERSDCTPGIGILAGVAGASAHYS